MKYIAKSSVLALLTLFSQQVTSATADSTKIQPIAVVFDKSITAELIDNFEVELFPGGTSKKPNTTTEADKYRVFQYLLYQQIRQQLEQDCKVQVSDRERELYLEYRALIKEQTRQHVGAAYDEYYDKLYEGLTKDERQALEQAEAKAELAEANAKWTSFYIDKCLYQKYGGAVIFQQANPQEPVGAMKAHLQQLQTDNKLKIYKEEYKQQFWAYYDRTHPFEAEAKDIDFSQPWWIKLLSEPMN